MSEILFQITEEQLETGLRGYPVGYCTTSFVDPEKGLFYRGRPISEFRSMDPEAVMFFLYTGKDPSGPDYKAFVDYLRKNYVLNDKVVKHIQMLPREGHPMKLFAAALQIFGMIEGTGEYKKDAAIMMSKLPHLVACIINYHAGWGDTKKPDPNKGYMENFAEMVNAPDKNLEQLTEVFRLFNILHYDHGGGNLSAFVGKAVASGMEDMYGSLTAAMCALAGPRHGKANQDCLAFVEAVHKELGDQVSEDQVETHIRKLLENKQLVYGFGHAVLRKEDARAAILYDFVEKTAPNHPLAKIAKLLRTAGPKVLKENPKISNPYPNVDAVSGTALVTAGFHYPEYFTVLFGLSRCIGIATQVIYERIEARGGKGTPIVRPKYIYSGKK